MPSFYISPYPEAEAQRRRAMNAHWNTWKKPEPVEAPKVYEIFGIEVSKEVYDKYNNKSYDFGDFVLHDLSAVKLYTEGRELPEYYPERAAAARKIREQIIAEITGKDVKKYEHT